MGNEYSSFGQINMLLAVSLTSGLHGPRVLLIMHFKDFEAMSMTQFAQVNLEYNFTLRYGWLDTVESGWPKRKCLCELGLILFVIGRWPHI